MPQQAWTRSENVNTTTSRTASRNRGSPNPSRERDRGPDREQGSRPGRREQDGQSSSIDDISSARRGGLRSHKGAGGRTYRQLYNEAKDQGIEGRSKMSKAQLERCAIALTRCPSGRIGVRRRDVCCGHGRLVRRPAFHGHGLLIGAR